jgi:ion channel-forming bestrophin family protein
MIDKKKFWGSEYNPMTLTKNIKENVFYKLFTNPSMYLKMLLTKTIGIGIFTFFVWLIVNIFDLHDYTIPATMHSLIGFVISLLLVFRNNTAYDRWWDGRKLIASLSTEVSVFTARLNSIESNVAESLTKNELTKFLNNLKTYLSKTPDEIVSNDFHIKQTNKLSYIMSAIDASIEDSNAKSVLINSLNKMMDYCTQLERIKNTPIPMSYKFHIKISVLIYLISLPFGMFHDLGFASIPLIMLIYYIMVGVEIISSEIENPFAGDPNDLPVDGLFNTMIETLNNETDGV